MDIDDDVGESEGEGEWVKRTGDVHLADSAEGDMGVISPGQRGPSQEQYLEWYNELLGNSNHFVV